MKPSRLLQALQRLAEVGVLTKGEEIEGYFVCTLSYDVVFKDSPQNRSLVERRERMKAANISGVVSGGKGSKKPTRSRPNPRQ